MCDATLASCECRLDEGHDGPHVCTCEGSWDDNGEIFAWPSKFVGDEELEQFAEEILPIIDLVTPPLPKREEGQSFMDWYCGS